jgi:gamma-glutamyltranspeptidase
LDSYGSPDAAKGNLGIHRVIEAMKHMFAVRMNLGDPDFENISRTVSEMLSPSFAQTIQRKILDNTTFPPEYYMYRCGLNLNENFTFFMICCILTKLLISKGYMHCMQVEST